MLILSYILLNMGYEQRRILVAVAFPCRATCLPLRWLGDADVMPLIYPTTPPCSVVDGIVRAAWREQVPLTCNCRDLVRSD